MKFKKKATGANCGINNYLNKNLSVRNYNTPSRFGQFIFSSQTVISTNPAARDRGLVRCYYCDQWVENFAGLALCVRPGAMAIKHGICKKCSDALLILPPNLQKKFVEKAYRNLRNALEGNSDD